MEFRDLLLVAQRHTRSPGPEAALAALSAFFRSLGERLQARDALVVAADLPREFATLVLSPPRTHGELFSVDEFVSRIAKREKVSDDRARQHATAIGGLLRERLSRRTMGYLLSALPLEFHELFAPLPPTPRPDIAEEHT